MKPLAGGLLRPRPAAGLPSAEELLALLDALPASVALWDDHVRLRYGNQRSLTRFGRPVNGLLGARLSELVLPQAVELSAQYIDGALAGRRQQVERAMVDAQGQRYNAHQVIHLPNVVDGAVRGYCALAVDITASIEGYEQARRARVAAAQRAERDRIAGDIDKQHVVDELSTALERLDAALDRAADALPSLATAAAAISRAIEDLRTTVPGRVQEELAAPLASFPGAAVPVDRLGQAGGVRWPPHITGRGWAAEDVCALLDLLPAEVAIWDPSLRNVFANRAAVGWFGRTDRADVVGEHARDLLGPELFEAANIAYAEAALRGAPQQFDCTVAYPGGQRHLQVYCAPRWRSGEADGIYSLVVDVTARVDAELELQEARASLAAARERERIGDQLHNLVIQRLFAAGLAATRPADGASDAQARSVQDGILAALGDLEAALTTLHENVQQLDLLPDLARLVHSIADPAGRTATIETVGSVEYLAPGVGAELLAAAEGAVADAVRCGARQVVVTVAADAAEARLRVTDDRRPAGAVVDWRAPVRS